MNDHFPHYEIFETIGEEGFQWRYRGPTGEVVAVCAARFRTYAECMASLQDMRAADDVALYVPTRFALTRAAVAEAPMAPRLPPRRKPSSMAGRSSRLGHLKM